eukprot:4418501-Pleurochrysis_carterae.AAC.4
MQQGRCIQSGDEGSSSTRGGFRRAHDIGQAKATAREHNTLQRSEAPAIALRFTSTTGRQILLLHELETHRKRHVCARNTAVASECCARREKVRVQSRMKRAEHRVELCSATKQGKSLLDQFSPKGFRTQRRPCPCGIVLDC